MSIQKYTFLRRAVAAILVGALSLSTLPAVAKKKGEEAPAGSALPTVPEAAQATTKFRIGAGGFEVLDPSGKVLKQVPVSGKVYDLLYFNRTLWVARGSQGVTPYDVSDPSNPKELATFCKNRTAMRLASHQKSLLVIVADYITTSYDITNLDEPVAVPPDAMHDKATGAAAEVEKLTFRPGGRGVEAVSNKGGTEKVVVDLPLMGSVLDVLRIGQALFVARGAAGVTGFDLANQSSPKRRATFGQGRPAVRLAEQDGRLMVIVADYTTLAFDVSDRDRPQPVVLVEQNSTVSLLGPQYNIPEPDEPPPAALAIDTSSTVSAQELAQARETIAAQTQEREDQEKKSTKKKWLWAGLGILLGGVVAAGVATAVVLRPRSAEVPSGVMLTQVEF